jgi:rSAM/selenodomain-associated transferase 1
MNLRSRLTGIATGDQGMFRRARVFASVGGFSADRAGWKTSSFSRLLKRRAGRPACLRERVRTSGRRWDRDGAWHTIVLMWKLRLAWRLGVDASTLARRYGLSGAPRRVLQVFAKAPEPGQVKTRLASALGEQAALEAYRALVEHTLGVAAEARRRGVVSAIELWCAPDTTHPAFVAWARRCGATLHAQVGAGLGERMHGALRDGLTRGVVPILIGTDCPAMDVGYLATASEVLETRAAVLGPVEDGGYALIGLTRDLDLFSGIAWSTARVMPDTRLALERLGARWAELTTLWDVDTEDDLARWRSPHATVA